VNGASDGVGTDRALVGRDQEIALLGGALEAASDGRGRLIIVHGPPGSGKTRLAREAARAAARRGMQVRWPSIASAGRSTGPAPPGDVVPVALAHAGATSALLLILDDLHAADEVLLASLAASANGLDTLPAVVLGTWTEPHISADPHPHFAEIARHVVRVNLGPLDVAATIALAEQAGTGVPRGLLERLYVVTGGNALLIVETLDALAIADRVDEDEPWPLSDRAVLWMRARLAALSPACRDAAEAASVLGVECDVTTVTRMLGEIGDELQTRLALEDSLLMGSLNGSGRGPFSPPLVRDLVYASLSDTRRAVLHARAAAVLGGTEPAALVHACLAASAARDPRRTEICLRRLAGLAVDGSTSPRDAVGAAAGPYFVREGEYWAIAFGSRAVRLRERAGIVYLARLLANPGVEMPAMALAVRARAEPSEPGAAEGGLAAERARVRVTRRIRDAIDRIAEAHPELGAHLARTVRTGARCSYLTDPSVAPRWDVRWSP